MSATPKTPGRPGTDVAAESRHAFDELAARAGAALRSAAPADGVAAIVARRRHVRVARASLAGGAAAALLVGALVVFASREDHGGLQVADSLPITTDGPPRVETTVPDAANETTASSATTAVPVLTSAVPVLLEEEEIRVAADSIELGERLVGFGEGMVRANGRTYVIAGVLGPGDDPFVRPDAAVLAAFDEDGAELWRTALDGKPRAVELLRGDLWVRRDYSITRMDSSDGQVLGEFPTGFVHDMVAGFDSLWVVDEVTDDPTGLRLSRLDPDMSAQIVELPLLDEQLFMAEVAAGAGVVWVPMGANGVAMIDPDTLELTMLPVDGLHGNSNQIALDGDVAYVTDGDQVTSIVEGRAHATATVVTDAVYYLGPVDGVFGVVLSGGRFRALQPDGPMVAATRQIDTEGFATEFDGQAWALTDHQFRPAHLLPD